MGGANAFKSLLHSYYLRLRFFLFFPPRPKNPKVPRERGFAVSGRGSRCPPCQSQTICEVMYSMRKRADGALHRDLAKDHVGKRRKGSGKKTGQVTRRKKKKTPRDHKREEPSSGTRPRRYTGPDLPPGPVCLCAENERVAKQRIMWTSFVWWLLLREVQRFNNSRRIRIGPSFQMPNVPATDEEQVRFN